MIKTLIIAHRGDHQNVPENSLSAFATALKKGADGIELDARLTRDGQVVVTHDMRLSRLFNSKKSVIKSTYAELQEFHFKDKIDEGLPLLRDVLDLCAHKLQINIEIKSFSGINFELTNKVLNLVNEFKINDSAWISCFNPFVIKSIKKMDKNIKTGFLFDQIKYMPLIFSEFIDVDAWHPNFKFVDEQFVEVAKKRNKELYVWTVNDESEKKRLLKLHVNGIITDLID